MEMVELHVRMCCHGCERTVRKALSKLKGVDSVEVDLDELKVTVTGYADRKKVLKAVRKSGKRAEFWDQQNNMNGRYNNQSMMRGRRNGNNGFNDLQNNTSQAFARTYNYERHGYNDNNGYSVDPYLSHHGMNETSLFSDENANACSIM